MLVLTARLFAVCDCLGSRNIYHYNQAGQLVAESDASGNITTEYIYLNGQPLAKLEDNTTYYISTDHLGTPQIMADAAAANVWQIETRPFGDSPTIAGTQALNLRFPGQYSDSETGLHQNWFRDYKPEIGRYVEGDPIGLKGGSLSIYSFVDNTPLNSFDFKGLKCVDCPSGNWSGAGGNVGGILLSGGVFTGIYKVCCWSSDKCCWVMVTCSGTGAGLGGGVSLEGMYVQGAYNSTDLSGESNDGRGFGGVGVVGTGGSASPGSRSGAGVLGSVQPSCTDSESVGVGLGLGGGYLIGKCKSTLLYCD